jgi:hypothetical protein
MLHWIGPLEMTWMRGRPRAAQTNAAIGRVSRM